MPVASLKYDDPRKTQLGNESEIEKRRWRKVRIYHVGDTLPIERRVVADRLLDGRGDVPREQILPVHYLLLRKGDTCCLRKRVNV